MNEHPLITAMKRAGDHTRRQADFLTRTNYGENETGVALCMWRLADALVQDWTGISQLNDTATMNDFTHPERMNARERMATRHKIADALERFPAEYREHVIDQLAAGNGAEEAHALRVTADRELARILSTIRANADRHAIATA